MNTLIDIIKSDIGYFAMLLVTLIGGFGMGCGITEVIFRWEGENDEEGKKHKTKHERISDTQGVLPTEAVTGRKRSSAVRSGKEAERQNRG